MPRSLASRSLTSCCRSSRGREERRLRRALPWLPAAAFALGALPAVAVAQDRTINAATTVNAEENAAQDTAVAAPGTVTVTGTGWLKAEDFVTSENVTIDVGGLLSTQTGGAAAPAPFSGLGNYTLAGGTTTVEGELFVGSNRDLSGAGIVRPTAPADRPAGTLAVDTGAVIAQLGGTMTANMLALTRDGDATVDGAGSTLALSGAATVDGAGSLLRVSNGGAFDGTTLALTDGGGAFSFDAGSTFTLAGDAAVDGVGSLLTAQFGGAFDGTALALTNGGGASVWDVGSTFTLTGGAAVDGANSDLNVLNGGVFNGATLALANNGDAVISGGGSTMTLTGAATADGAGSVLSTRSGGVFNGTTLALTNEGDAFINGLGAAAGTTTFTLTGAAAVDGEGSFLSTQNGGVFSGTTLALTGGGDALTSDGGSTTTLSGAAAVDGAGSVLETRFGGTFNGTTLALTNGGVAASFGAGSTKTLTGAVTVDGAGSQLAAQSGGAVNAASAMQSGGLIDVQSGSTMTFANDVTVDGGETRVNGTLTAANLLINNGGTLTGAGTIVGDLAMNGRLAPGNSPGVLNVTGNFASGPGMIYDLELQAAASPVAGTDFDQTAVTGTATVNGGTVNVQPFGNSAYRAGMQYAFLTADGGLTVVNPVTVNESLANVRFIQQIGATEYALIAARDQSFAQAGATFNTRQVGAGLDAVRNDPALADLRNAIDTLADPVDVDRALNQLSGEIYGTQLTALNRSSLQFLDVVGGQGGAYPLACGACNLNGPGLEGWIEGYGASGRIDGDGNAFDAQTGSAGAAVGLTRNFGGPGACVSVGAFYGFESLTTQVSAANSTVTDKVVRAGGSVKSVMGPTYARLSGFGGVAFGDALRSVSIDSDVLPFADGVDAETGATLAAGDAEFGTLFGSEARFLTPVVGVRYVHVDRDGFTEDGGAAALDVDNSTLKELRARVGMRAGHWIDVAGMVPMTATFEAFYSRDVSAGSIGDYRAQFDAAPAGSFEARGTDFGRDRVTLGPGLAIGGGPIRLASQYRVGLTETSVLHSGDVRVELCY
ncbi:autotransporter outer membrane beta-barrel domain-containing protein [Alienimonas chondri]|uniref:Autotransporter domain-containing protein n=1 Tax=Alienimonas chondri TaxID=2681879 RepID=A0ABX1VHV1_9PLAN|nr:autotransporter domain-containing protein [Alienimonas chondri]NNJ27412.1 hypothetical protein [Alienimonas chondri]